MPRRSLRGPAAVLALFAQGECRKLNHKHCGQRGCPCDEARAWLRTLPRTATIAAIWRKCRSEWRDWICLVARVPTDSGWKVVLDALLHPKPVTKQKCDHCDKEVDSDELCDGYCEDCHSEVFVWCSVCDAYQYRESSAPCDHMIWSDAAGEFVGAGNGHHDGSPLAESLHKVCTKLGLRKTEKLRAAIARTSKWRFLSSQWGGVHHGGLDERLDTLRDQSRDNDDRGGREYALIWLRTLDFKTTAANAKTLALLDAHIKARRAAIARDWSPRRVVRDGARRYWCDGGWVPVKFKARWMSSKRAAEVRDVLRAEHPGCGALVVHVLTKAPAFTKGGGTR